LTEIVPGLARVAVLSNPLNPSMAVVLEQTKVAAQSLGIEIYVVEVEAPDKFERAFAAVTTVRAGALIVLPDAMLYGQHPRIVTFTAAAHLPALFPEKEVAEAGGEDPPPVDLRPGAQEQVLRAPLQVMDGNFQRLKGVCPWWDSVIARH
jgi:ABC-type uncharacterized transport system substrate-binding protein